VPHEAERGSGIRAQRAERVVSDFELVIVDKLSLQALAGKEVGEPVLGVIPHLLIGDLLPLKPGGLDLF